jgi:hypothetical protein
VSGIFIGRNLSGGSDLTLPPGLAGALSPAEPAEPAVPNDALLGCWASVEIDKRNRAARPKVFILHLKFRTRKHA